LFDFLVLALYFAITLRMVGSSETGLNIKALVKGFHEMGSKLQAVIREDLFWNSMKVEYVGVIDISGTLGCKVKLAEYEVALIQVVINVDIDGIEAIQSWKLDDQVNADVFPGCSWCFMRLKHGI
jgi:hypothetical protein